MNLGNRFVMCPFCACEAWIISGVWFRCFLCGAKFYGKVNLSGQPPTINRNLRVLKQMGMYRLPDEEDYDKEILK